MKLNRSLICTSVLAAAVTVTGMAFGQDTAAPAQAPAAAQAGGRGAGGRGGANGTTFSRSGNAPYQSSPEAYQRSGPFGCAGCPSDADRAAGEAAVSQAINQAGQARDYVNGQLVAAGGFGGGAGAPAAGAAQAAGGGQGGGRRGGGGGAAAAPAGGAGQAAGANAAAAQQGGGGRRFVGAAAAPQTLPYDLLLRGGHVIDDKNHIDKVTDVGIKDGKIAAVGDNLRSADAAKTVSVTGFYVIPGMIDLHMHMYASTGEGGGSYAGDDSIWPDGFTLRTGVTTAVDAGSSGWRNFEDFKEHIIDRSRTHVVAMLNIVGAGMRGGRYENNLDDMDGEITGYMAKRYPGVVVGIKSAHFTGPEWKPYIEAVKAGNIANIPVMIDYGSNRTERPMAELVSKYLRPGDIYTHTYSGLRNEQDTATLKPSAGLLGGRAHGVYFDAGTGGGSFRFRVAVPLLAAGFKPDSLSTDLHTGSFNSSTKDMLNVMSKFMAMGLTLQEVVADTTSHPAHEIKQEQLGNLSVGSPADVAVLSEQHGTFGYLDMDNMKMMGNVRLQCELTLRNGIIVYDLNGTSMDVWNKPPYGDSSQARHWTSFAPRPPNPNQLTPDQK